MKSMGRSWSNMKAAKLSLSLSFRPTSLSLPFISPPLLPLFFSHTFHSLSSEGTFFLLIFPFSNSHTFSISPLSFPHSVELTRTVQFFLNSIHKPIFLVPRYYFSSSVRRRRNSTLQQQQQQTFSPFLTAWLTNWIQVTFSGNVLHIFLFPLSLPLCTILLLLPLCIILPFIAKYKSVVSWPTLNPWKSVQIPSQFEVQLWNFFFLPFFKLSFFFLPFFEVSHLLNCNQVSAVPFHSSWIESDLKKVTIYSECDRFKAGREKSWTVRKNAKEREGCFLFFPTFSFRTLFSFSLFYSFQDLS